MSSSTSFKAKPTIGSSKASSSSLPAKKIETSSKHQIPDAKNKSVSKTMTIEVKASSSSKTTTATVKRAKKVFSLPGQKHDPPEEREPLRIFYESLSEQIPSSEMAEFWLMEHGLLSLERAGKAFEKKQRKQKQLRTGTPIKSPPRPSKPETSIRQQQAPKNGETKVKKRIIDDSDEDDFILSPKRRKGEINKENKKEWIPIYIMLLLVLFLFHYGYATFALHYPC